MSEEITQLVVDDMIQQCREEWEKMVDESGINQTVFIATSKRATEFLAKFEEARQEAIRRGFDVPPLLNNVTVTISEIQ